MTFNQISQSAVYKADEISVSLTVCGGTYGGGSEVLIVTIGEQNGIFNAKNRRVQEVRTGFHACSEDVQECDRSYSRGGDPVSEPTYMSDRKGHNGISDNGTATTLNAQEKERPLIAEEMHSVVRRLTPLECERLQGMPDNWSKYGINEKGEVFELSDSARYRLQGNGIATPFWRWLLKRISAQYERTPTLGSLFDGQGSFPMIWEGINGSGTALWSSEIDKNAIAVCKYHFPEERSGELSQA